MSSLIREDAGQILPERERGNYRPIKRKAPHVVMRNTASSAIPTDILLTPWALSIKVIGISATDPPREIARLVISIWKQYPSLRIVEISIFFTSADV